MADSAGQSDDDNNITGVQRLDDTDTGSETESSESGSDSSGSAEAEDLRKQPTRPTSTTVRGITPSGRPASPTLRATSNNTRAASPTIRAVARPGMLSPDSAQPAGPPRMATLKVGKTAMASFNMMGMGGGAAVRESSPAPTAGTGAGGGGGGAGTMSAAGGSRVWSDVYDLVDMPTFDANQAIEELTPGPLNWWQLLWCGMLLIPVGLEGALWTFLTFGHVCGRGFNSGIKGAVFASVPELHYFCGASDSECKGGAFDVTCLSDTTLAVVMVAAAMCAAAGSYIFGGVSDQYGRAGVLRVCAVGSLVCVLIGWPGLYPLFVVSRAGAGFFFGGACVTFALVSECVSYKLRVVSLVVLHGFWLVGFVVGMLIGLGGFAALSMGTRAVILQYAALVPLLVATVVAAVGIVAPRSKFAYLESPRWIAMRCATVRPRGRSPSHVTPALFSAAADALTIWQEGNSKRLPTGQMMMSSEVSVWAASSGVCTGSFGTAVAAPAGLLGSADVGGDADTATATSDVRAAAFKHVVLWLMSGFCWYGVVLAVPFVITVHSNAAHYPVHVVISVEMVVAFMVGGVVLSMMGKRFSGVWFAALAALWLIIGMAAVFFIGDAEGNSGAVVSFGLSIFLTSSVLTFTALHVTVVAGTASAFATCHRGSGYGLSNAAAALGGMGAQLLTLLFLLRDRVATAIVICLLIVGAVVCAIVCLLLPKDRLEGRPQERMLCDAPGFYPEWTGDEIGGRDEDEMREM